MKLNEIHDDDGGVGVIDREKEDVATKKPPMFHVYLNNDDYVSGTAVVGALSEAFGFDNQRSAQIMIAAHREGKAIVGTFSKDVAETKAAQAVDWVMKFHNQQGVEDGVSPHVFSVEPAE